MKLKKAILLGSLAITTTASAAVATAMITKYKNQTKSNYLNLKSGIREFEVNLKESTGSNLKNFDQLEYYAVHKNELDAKVIPIFNQLAERAKISLPIQNWINNLSDDYLDVNVGVNSIKDLKIEDDLKLFLLQNYLDKLSIFESSLKNQRLNIEEHQNLTRAANVFAQKAGSNYILSNVTVQKNMQSWDIGEHKGMIDPISGKYFAEDLSSTPNRGWSDSDADSEWSANEVTFEFLDKITGEKQSFSLYYNAAKDTDWENEDYTFVAIVPGKKSDGSLNTFVTEDNKTVPALFGKPLDFRKMQNLEALNHNLHIDAPYFASSHTHDAGSDNDWGNYMDGIVLNGQTYSLDQRDGTWSMSHVAKNVLEYIDNELNDEFTGTLNTNYLYDPSSKEPSYIAIGGYRVPKHGIDSTVNDHHTWKNDNTYFNWSNQTVWNYTSGLIIQEMNKASKTYQDAQAKAKNIQDAAQQSAAIGDAFRQFTKEMENVQKTARLVGMAPSTSGWLRQNILRATKNNGIAIALTLLATDWTSLESISDSAISLSTSIAASEIVGNLATALFASGSSLAAAVAEEAGVAIGSEAAGVELGAIAGPAGVVASAITTAILSFVPVGNGHSVMSNFGDHGLNDWTYQWDHNQENMLLTTYNFSYNYSKGITWDVEDGWFSLPDVFIKTQGDEYSWKNLSPNSEFNYGHSIPVGRP